MIAKLKELWHNLCKREEDDMIQLSEHFSIKEAICHDSSNSSKPCPYCHGVFIPCDTLLKALEAFRSNVDAPVIITSWTRCQIKEAKMKPNTPSPKSQHNYGKAVDCYVNGVGAQALYDAAIKVPAFNNGGIGIYVKQTSGRDRIHLDVRDTGKARWGYISNKEVSIEEALKQSK